MDMFARFRFAGLSRLTVLSFLLFGFTTSFASELIDSTRSGDLETVTSLITDGSDLNEATGDGMTAVHWAAQLGHVSILESLLDAGAEVNPTTRIGSYTPLHLASSQANSEIVRTLLEGGADVSAATTNSLATALHLAAQEVGGAESV